MGSPGARSPLDLEEAEAVVGKTERSGENVSALGLWPNFREVPKQLLPAYGLQPCHLLPTGQLLIVRLIAIITK